MKVTQNTIKNARSGNTFWRVQVRLDWNNKIRAHKERVDLVGPRLVYNLGFSKECRQIAVGPKDGFRYRFLSDLAGHSPSVQTFTQEKQANNFVFEIENEPHLHPEVINDVFRKEENRREYDNFVYDWD